MVSINRNFGVKAANTQPPAQEAVTKNDKNGTTKKEPAAYPEEQKAANQYGKDDLNNDIVFNEWAAKNPNIISSDRENFNLFDHIF